MVTHLRMDESKCHFLIKFSWNTCPSLHHQMTGPPSQVFVSITVFVYNIPPCFLVPLPWVQLPQQTMNLKTKGLVFIIPNIIHICLGASGVAQIVDNLLAMQETWVWSLFWDDPLEKGMATHSSILYWRIPWTEEPDELQSMRSQRVRHNWGTNTFISVSPVPDTS